MRITSEGIVLRRTKIANGRRIILLLTYNLGKISAGTNLNERNNTRSSAALRPFAYGTYQLFQGRNYYNLDRADTLRTFYGIGENPDKFLYASTALELTEKIIPQEVPQPAIFNALIDFLRSIEKANENELTILLAYEVKLLRITGLSPGTDVCAECGKTEKLNSFSVPAGGMICSECMDKIQGYETVKRVHDSLIYRPEFDIISILKYFETKPISAFESIVLNPRIAAELRKILKQYFLYHFDLGELKSEKLFLTDL